jgi:hypothetical protein
MEPEQESSRFNLAETIFCDAIGLPFDQRAAFVAGRCASDVELREIVMRMVTRFDRMTGFLEEPAIKRGGAGWELRPGTC